MFQRPTPLQYQFNILAASSYIHIKQQRSDEIARIRITEVLIVLLASNNRYQYKPKTLRHVYDSVALFQLFQLCVVAGNGWKMVHDGQKESITAGIMGATFHAMRTQ